MVEFRIYLDNKLDYICHNGQHMVYMMRHYKQTYGNSRIYGRMFDEISNDEEKQEFLKDNKGENTMDKRQEEISVLICEIQDLLEDANVCLIVKEHKGMTYVALRDNVKDRDYVIARR